MSFLLVVGLGNPGRDYELTRHNAGFAIVDALATQLGLAWRSDRSHSATVARWDPAPGRAIVLAKPLTFMNESGLAVQSLASFHKIPPAQTIVVYDDLNIELGLVKVSVSGSAGGHNGVADLLARVGDGFTRFRLGIGPKTPAQIELKDFVLGRFTPEQSTIFNQTIPTYLTGLRYVIDHGADRAMNLLNRRAIP